MGLSHMGCINAVDKLLIDKMIKALTPVTNIKGATLVKDDLFEN